MAATISAFGYTVPLRIILVFIALVVGLALTVMFWLTVVWSIYRSVGKSRREQVREDLENNLVDGIFDPETDWNWVDDLSSTERNVLETLLDEYLRELDGQNVENLRDLGEMLNIPARSERQLQKRGEYKRLSALTWLALLDRPESLRDAAFSPGTPRERAAVARLRHDSDDLATPKEGLSILLDGTKSQFSVFGQDTLYQIATDDPSALFEIATNTYRGWSDALLVQVLVVSRYLGTSVTTEDLSWMTGPLEHENETVRRAATLALGSVGWRADVRDSRYLDRLVSDPSPRVRAAAYQTLARWGDEEALETLTTNLQTEENPRSRLAGAEALVTQEGELNEEHSLELEATWTWCKEHDKYDRVARTGKVGD